MSEPKKPPTKKPPFYLSYSSQRTNPKVAALTDAEYRAWHYALCSARLSVPAGQWPSRDYLAADLGRKYAKHIDRLIALDLLRVDEDGVIMSANWEKNQEGLSDPTGAARQARWREREKAKKAVSQPPVALPVRNALRNTDKKRLEESRVDKTRLDTNRDETNASDEISSTVATPPDGAPLPSLPTRQWKCELCPRPIFGNHRTVPLAGGGIAHEECAPPPDEVDNFDE